MRNTLAENLEALMEAAAGFFWRQFEKDLALTQAILDGVERLWARIRSPLL